MRSALVLFFLVGVAAFAAEPERQVFTSESPAMVFSRVAPSVVLIRAESPKGTAQGSGVVVGTNLVVTNLHVVGGATKVLVSFRGVERLATVSATTKAEKDLALLSVETGTTSRVSLRRSTELAVGERVFAIGNPRGLEQTLTEGLVSALRKEGEVFVVQTSAAISPGSSGGGLFDTRGRLVGITTKTRADGQSLNFAHPVEWVDELLKGGGKVTGAEAPAPAFSVTQRPAALLCELSEGARWGLFSEGPELLESVSAVGPVLLTDLDTTQPTLGLKGQKLVLNDLSRKQQVAVFRSSAETVFLSFDEASVRVTLAWVVSERGEPRLVTKSGLCVPGEADELKKKLRSAAIASAPPPADLDCDADPAGCYAAALKTVGGEKFLMMKKACRNRHRQACDEAIELATTVNDTASVEQLEKLRRSARLFDVPPPPDAGVTGSAPATSPTEGSRRPLKTP